MENDAHSNDPPSPPVNSESGPPDDDRPITRFAVPAPPPGASIVSQVEKQFGVRPDAHLPPGPDDRPYAPKTAFGDRYRIAGEIARGGMGIVLDAKDVDIHRELAIKVMVDGRESTADQVLKFIEEAQIQGQLEHPNICPVHELGLDAEGCYYFTMKKVQGKSLAEILADPREGNPKSQPDGVADETYLKSEIRNPKSLVRLLEIFLKICDAVAFAHSRGVIHRDLKPENILIGPYGEVLVMDWGVAKIVGRPDRHAGGPVTSERMSRGLFRSLDGTVLGTPPYMPPEQAQGKVGVVGPRSDIYMLGGILYFLLTGRPPVEGKTVEEVLDKVTGGAIVPPTLRAPGRRIPRDLEAACLKAMEYLPEDRYASVPDLRADIEAYLEGRTLAAADYSPLQLAGKWVRRNRTFAGTAAAAAGVLLAMAVFYVVNVTRARASAERAAGIAEDRRKVADARLAQSLMAQGDVLGTAGRWREAQARYAEAGATFRSSEMSALPADLGLLASYPFAPPVLMSVEHDGGAWTCTTLTPDGRRALAGTRRGMILLWDLPRGRVLRKWKGHPGEVRGLAFSPDGRRALSCGQEPVVRLWDLTTGEAARELKGHQANVAAVAFSPDGRFALTGGHDRTAKWWDLETGIERRSFSTRGRPVWCVAVSPDGRLAATGGPDATILLWDLEAGTERRALNDGKEAPYRHWGSVVSLSFSPDGRSILSGSADHGALLWNIATGEPRHAFEEPAGSVAQVAFSPDGHLACTATNRGGVRLWDADGGRPRRTIDGFPETAPAGCVSLALPTALCAAGPATLRLLDAGLLRDVREFDGKGGPADVSPDGRLVASASRSSLRIWDLATGEDLRFLTGHADAIRSVRFSPDGRLLVTGGKDRTVRVWDLYAGKEAGYFAGHSSPVAAAVFLPDGRGVISGGVDGTVRRFDIAPSGRYDPSSGREIFRCQEKGRGIAALAVSPDGRRVAALVENGTLAILNPVDSRTVRTVKAHSTAGLCAAFSPDGRIVATGGAEGEVRLIEAETGRIVRSLAGHPGAVMATAFSPDGRQVVSGGADGVVRMWDASSGEERGVFRSTASAIRSAVFTPDGASILLADQDGTVRVADLARPGRYREWERRLPEIRKTLGARPDDAEALRALGEWYLWRGLGGWGAEILEQARRAGAQVSSMAIGRGLWTAGLREEAVRELERAQAGEAPGEYLELCLHALRGSAVPTPGGSTSLTPGTATVADAAAPNARLATTRRDHEQALVALAVSPDGHRMATSSRDKTVRLWDLDAREPLAVVPCPQRATALAFSPDGKRLAVAMDAVGTVRVMGVDTLPQGPSFELAGHEKVVRALAFSPDGKTLATGSADRTVKLWDVETRKERKILGELGGPVAGLAFSPDGRLLAVGGADRAVKVWDLTAEAEPRTIEGHTAWVRKVAFSPDGTALASAGEDGRLILRDAASGKERWSVKAHEGTVWGLAFSPDGRAIATCGDDDVARVWDASSGRARWVAKGHKGAVKGVAFSNDGKTLVTGGTDREVRWWEISGQ